MWRQKPTHIPWALASSPWLEGQDYGTEMSELWLNPAEMLWESGLLEQAVNPFRMQKWFCAGLRARDPDCGQVLQLSEPWSPHPRNRYDNNSNYFRAGRRSEWWSVCKALGPCLAQSKCFRMFALAPGYLFNDKGDKIAGPEVLGRQNFGLNEVSWLW